MRHLITLAAVAALAACSVDVEGAACLDDANCPAGQRCGHGGTCSAAAAACPGEICQQHECAGQTARRCVVSGEGPCASFEEEVCSARQACNAETGTCDCASGGCATGLDSFCASIGEVVACATEAATGCRYEASSSPCALGQTCGGAPSATCSCPTVGACTTSGATSCDGARLLECVPVEVGSLCNVWVEVEDCALSQLSCSPGTPAACTCPSPAQSPVVLHADPGAQTRPGLVRSGALDPSICRHQSLSAALAAASSGATVKAVGYAGTAVVFTEGPLTIPAGVSVTTDDATPNPANYVVEPSGTVGASTFVSMKPGAALAGFEVRNVSASGVGVETSCTEVGDTATATIDAVRITGLGTGTTPPRFSFGLRHSSPGRCSLAISGTNIGGASDTGVLISNVAPTSTLTIANSVIQGNQGGGTAFTIGPAPARKAGGIAFVGTLPGTVDFRANRVLGNGGDQILVFSTGTLDLSRVACGPDANVIACYASGVGLSSKAGTVKVGYSTWSSPAPAEGTDYILEAGADITGLTETCSFLPASSCP